MRKHSVLDTINSMDNQSFMLTSFYDHLMDQQLGSNLGNPLRDLLLASLSQPYAYTAGHGGHAYADCHDHPDAVMLCLLPCLLLQSFATFALLRHVQVAVLVQLLVQ